MADSECCDKFDEAGDGCGRPESDEFQGEVRDVGEQLAELKEEEYCLVSGFDRDEGVAEHEEVAEHNGRPEQSLDEIRKEQKLAYRDLCPRGREKKGGG